MQVTLPTAEVMNGKDLPAKPDGTKGKHVGPREHMTRDVLKREKIRFLKSVGQLDYGRARSPSDMVDGFAG